MPEPGHLGLAAMQERAEVAGGWFRLTSTRGAGTTVEAWLPKQEENAPDTNLPGSEGKGRNEQERLNGFAQLGSDRPP